jgi:TonB family protein
MKKIIFALLVSFFAVSSATIAQKTAPKGVIEANNSEMTVFPSFPQGEAQLQQFLAENVKKPSGERKTGSVTVYLVIDEQGVASGHRVFKSIGSADYDAAALEAVKNVARWTPGSMAGNVRKMGHKVEVKF